MPSVMFIPPLSTEATVPVSMKEVGGYIEKQVAYLSGEALVDSFSVITHLPLSFDIHGSLSPVQGAAEKIPV